MTLRIGIVGTENSHVDHLVTHLNVERRYPVRVTALAGGDSERNRQLADAGAIERLVDDVADLLPLADALIVTDRHGGRHAEHALPFLHAGRPVWVDKPFATTVADAEAMTRAAGRAGAPLTSYSALRWLPAFLDVQAALPDLGPLQAVIATGPADPDDEHGGLFFYGAHAVNVALGLLPDGPVHDVQVQATGAGLVASGRVGDTLAQVVLIRPDDAGAVPFQVQAIGRHGAVQREFELGEDYLLGALQAFLDLAAGGPAPIPPDRLVRDVAFLEAIGS